MDSVNSGSRDEREIRVVGMAGGNLLEHRLDMFGQPGLAIFDGRCGRPGELGIQHSGNVMYDARGTGTVAVG
jgi:hypothetical protein